MKTIGKGATPATNEQSLRWTMESGIRPIPNQMFGFPDDDFDSIRDNIAAWKRLGLNVKPFFATPYPGTEWYYTYRIGSCSSTAATSRSSCSISATPPR